MQIRTFDYCALRFLNQWLESEKALSEALSSQNKENQRKTLISAGGYFRIARNAPKKYEVAAKVLRYEPVFKVFEKLEPVTKSNVTEIVNKAQREISNFYGERNVLSLTSKFLWLKVKSHIRVYDRQARIALKTKDGDYSEFNNAFTERYEECEDQIEKSCLNLEKVILYSAKPDMRYSELKQLTSNLWFKERVLDIYLWNEGNA